MNKQTKKIKKNFYRQGLDKVFGFAKIKAVNPPCAAFGPRRVFIPHFLFMKGAGFNFIYE